MQTNIYFFNGPDTFKYKNTLKELKKKFIPEEFNELSYQNYYGDEIIDNDLLSNVLTPPFGTTHKIITVQNFNKIKNKTLLKKVLTSCPDNCFLLLTQEDSSLKNQSLLTIINKSPNIQITNSKKPNAYDIKKRIQDFFNNKKRSIDNDAIELLTQHFSHQPIGLNNELNKIEMYFSAQSNTSPNITANVLENLLCELFESAPFDIVNNFTTRNRKKTLQLLIKYIKSSGQLIPLQAMLYKAVSTLISYMECKKEGIPDQQIQQQLNINYYRFKSLPTEASVTTRESVYPLLTRLINLEEILKSSNITTMYHNNRINLEALTYLQKIIVYYCI